MYLPFRHYSRKVQYRYLLPPVEVHGTFGDTAADKGYVVEMAIPRTLLRVVADRLMFNATLYDQNGSDTFTGLTATNYEKWLPIVLKASALPTCMVKREEALYDKTVSPEGNCAR